MKYSIVIPVYNTEKYLEKCLDSVINQTYRNFEIIIVNDGSTDASKKIISKYAEKYDYITVINQKNQGLSMARNNGIKKVKSPYFLLLDSDDTLDKELLEKLDKVVDEKPDLVRFQINRIDSSGEKGYHEKEFYDLTGDEAFKEIVKYHYIENACCYLYSTKYFKDNKYLFPKGVYHEDYALIPLVIFKAKSVTSIDFCGYDYYERENSITMNSDYNKIKKKVFDFYNNYLNLIKELDKIKKNDILIKSYLANSLVLKITELQNKEYKEYLQKLKNDKVFDNILSDTFSRKIKKIILKINPKFYYRRR